MDLKNCALIRKEEIDNSLSSPATPGKKLLEPMKSLALANKLPFNILEDHEVLNNEAEVHKHESDLWLCIEGEPTFVYGGELENGWPKKNADGTIDDREWKAKSIRGGTEVVLRPGDWLWIPAGQAHQHQCAKTARLAIIKIPGRI